MSGSIAALLVVGALAGGAAAGGASGVQRLDPGVTPTSIEIGGTFPLTGLQSSMATIPEAEAAYFDYVNAHGGVNGRTIDFEQLDDAGDPSQTVLQTQKLVEQDGVFAVFSSAGVSTSLAVFDYLNERHVPQVLLASVPEYWGYDYKTHPWTIGFPPDAPGEARIYGEYIRAHLPGARVGVLYQDSATGKGYLAGLRAGIGIGNKNVIVGTQPYEVSQPDVSQQLLALKSSGADVFLVAASQPQAGQALVLADQDGWQRRATFVAFIGGTNTNMRIAASNGASIDGDISSQWYVDPNTPAEANLPGVVLGKQILSEYAPNLDQTNRSVFSGLAAAWTMVYALRNAGSPPTRAGLMTALRNLDPTKARNPFLYPGIALETSPADNFPIEQQQLVTWVGGATGYWQPTGPLYGHAR